MQETGIDFLVIGAGIAGLTAAASIRERIPQAEILLINGEDFFPYKRTNLSKYIASGFAADDFELTNEKVLRQYYRISLCRDRIVKIDFHGKTASGTIGSYRYQTLILATGSEYRVPESLQSRKTYVFHNKKETLALINTLGSARKVVVLGAGVQGLETVYQLLQGGKQVCLIDRNPFPLKRFDEQWIGEQIQKDLSGRGVQCFWNARLEAVREEASLLLEIRGDSERTVSADLVILCHGTSPQSGLYSQTPVVKPDEYLQLEESVFACGDLVSYADNSRCQLWHEAMAQGQCAGYNAAASRTGAPLTPFERKPYRTKIEIADRIFFLAPVGKDLAKNRHRFLYRQNYYHFVCDEQNRLQGAYLVCSDRNLLKPLQEQIWRQSDYREALENLQIDPALCGAVS